MSKIYLALLPLFLVGILFILTSSFSQPASAQTPVTPTLYCLSPNCPNPSTSISPMTSVDPTEIVTNTEPCTPAQSQSSVNHNHHDGGFLKSMFELMFLMMDLILKLAGGNSIPCTSPTTPTPIPSIALEPTVITTPATTSSVSATTTSPTIFEDFTPWSGITSPNGIWRIAGTWTGTGNNTLEPKNGVLSQSYSGANGGVLSLTSRANVLDGGELQSLKQYSYGYYEVRIKVSAVPGNVASFFWMEGPNYGPHEWDIEFLTKEPNHVYYTIHPSETTFVQTLPFTISSGFHRYGFLWTPGKIDYTVDGKIIHSFTDASLTTNATGFMMMNSWTGKPDFGGGPPTQDSTSVYDWVKFYAGATAVPQQ